VQLGLDQNITRLGNWLRFLNIILAPELFAVVTVLIGLLLRRRQLRKAHA
jgi:lipopolysaccharide/colanic/teichoic acid biosynthesis glycosyltransferase